MVERQSLQVAEKWKQDLTATLWLDCSVHCAKKHSKLPRNGTTTWVTIPCRSVRKDKVDRHINSSIHAAAAAAQKDLVASQVHGGIGQAMKDAVSLQLKAV